MRKLGKWIKTRFKTAVRIVMRFSADNGLTAAGALCFYFLMSVLPLNLLALSVLGYVMGSKADALSAVTNFGMRIFPEGSVDIKNILDTLVSGRGVFGGLAIVLWAWFSAGIFYTMEVAVNRIFRSGRKRGFFRRTAVVYFFMLVAGVLLIVTIAFTIVAAIVSNLSVSFLHIDSEKIPLLWNISFSLLPPALAMLMFAIIYKVGPTSKVSWSAALKGAIFAAVFWELSRRLFGWYLSTIALYNKFYGALGTLVAIFIWLFYSSIIFLLGAEYAAISNERYERGLARARVSPKNDKEK